MQDEITYWSIVLFERLIVSHLVKALPMFYAALRFFAMLTNVHNWTLP
jgi:hypothetical protein